MIKRRSQVLSAWFLLCDLLLTGLAWVGAWYIRFETGWIPLTKEPIEFGHCWSNLPLVLLLAFGSYHLTGQYAVDRLRRLREEVVCVAKGTAHAAAVIYWSWPRRFSCHDPVRVRAATMLLFHRGLSGPSTCWC